MSRAQPFGLCWDIPSGLPRGAFGEDREAIFKLCFAIALRAI
jgi:hypothetical protein